MKFVRFCSIKKTIFQVCCVIIYFTLAGSAKAQPEYQSKIYVHNDTFFMPLVKDKFKGIVYIDQSRNAQDKELNEYVLMIGISSISDNKLKYALLNNKILISLSHIDRHDKWRTPPAFVLIHQDSLKKSNSDLLSDYLKRYRMTIPFIDSYWDSDTKPFSDRYSNGEPVKLLLYDFSTDNDTVFFTIVSNTYDKLAVWRYPNVLNNNHLNKDTSSLLIAREYAWTSDEDFYTLFLREQLFLFTESGYIFRLGETAEKLGQLPDNLIDSAIVVDKDHDRLYLLKKSHIEEGLTFAEMLKKYAQEIKLPEK